MTVWWSDWSWDGWNYVNGGAIALVLVLVCVACCIAASLPVSDMMYYHHRYDRAPVADDFAPTAPPAIPAPRRGTRGPGDVEMHPRV